MPKNGVDFKFPVADGSHKLAGRDQVLRTPTLIQDDPARGEEHHDVLQGESDGFQPTDQQADTVEARDDFWSISGNHHVGPWCLRLTLSGGQVRHWMCCWKVARTIVGTWMVAGNHRGRGAVSPSSQD